MLTKIAYLYKEARSAWAKRVREYNRMLKSLHGGQEGVNQEILSSGSRQFPRMFHGTSAENAAHILEEGMDPNLNLRGRLGTGSYFGNKEKAEVHSGLKERTYLHIHDGGVEERFQLNNRNLDRSRIPESINVDEILETLRQNPQQKIPGISHQPGALIRFRTPAELKQTNQLQFTYPKASNVRVLSEEPKWTMSTEFPENAPKSILDYDVSIAESKKSAMQDALAQTPMTKQMYYGQAGRDSVFSFTDKPAQREFHVTNEWIRPELLRAEGEVAGYTMPLNQSAAIPRKLGRWARWKEKIGLGKKEE